eukprot:TRINITY_DN17571_c0_g1_i1.p1 TRINITY_DN17571_c0_g1~~TRINITY_DN17571_c0_g1_i1.p1  ORF type:complete len:238 (-),score=24.04 TRINITY_DN17571_c0_g1_i1:130-843(-)
MAPIRPFVAIGDIHGHARKLAALIDQLKATVPDFHKVLVVFLGDYVDRGPDVKTTIDLLLEFAEARRETGETVFLCGNHDFALMAFLGLLPSPFDATQTLRDFSGGLDTLWPPPGADAAAVAAGAAMHLQGRRYAPPHGSIFQAEATFKSYGATYGDREALGQNMPLEHKNFFANLQFIYADHSEYIFVHGGLEEMKWNSAVTEPRITSHSRTERDSCCGACARSRVRHRCRSIAMT